MSLFPVAPTLRVRLPRAIHAREAFVAEILVDAREDVRLDWIDARLEARERWQAGAGESSIQRHLTTVALRARVFDGGVLPAGAHVLRARFELPQAVPPSFAIPGASAETLLHVEASIPWWPDARASFVVPVRAEPRAAPPQPYRATNQARGADVPRVEISLATADVPARGEIAGALALFHHDARALRGARLAIVARARFFFANGREHRERATAYTIALPDDLRGDGTPVPFRVRVPDDVVPGFASRSLALEWSLEVERPGLLSTVSWLAIPLAVHEAGDRESASLEVPPIGDARLARALAAVAAELGHSVDGDALVGTVSGVGIRVTRALRAGGHVLEGALALPRLGLGLSLRRARALDRVLGGPIELGVRDLDARYWITARDPDQASAFLARIEPVLRESAIVSLDDGAMRLEQDDPTLDERSLAAFTERCRASASAIADAIAAIVPPTRAIADRDAWGEVATELGARCVIGDLSISGASGQSEVAIETDLDAAAHRIRVRPAPPLPDDLALSIQSPREPGPAIERALATALAALPESARDLEISTGRATLRLPLAREGERVVTDPRAALRAAGILAGLGAQLAPRRGPFR